MRLLVTRTTRKKIYIFSFFDGRIDQIEIFIDFDAAVTTPLPQTRFLIVPRARAHASLPGDWTVVSKKKTILLRFPSRKKIIHAADFFLPDTSHCVLDLLHLFVFFFLNCPGPQCVAERVTKERGEKWTEVESSASYPPQSRTFEIALFSVCLLETKCSLWKSF